MKLFKNVIKKDIIERINNNEFPVTTAMNNLNWKTAENGDKIAWLNPDNQTAFKCGWYMAKDFEEWVNGTGNIVKGNIQEEKDKFMHYAKLYHKYPDIASILYEKEFFHLINDSYRPNRDRYNDYIVNSMKITKKNNDHIISNLFGYVCSYYVDTFASILSRKPKEIHTCHSMTIMRGELWGLKFSCFNLGVGYFGASNTPRVINNLSWFANLTITKSIYLALLQNGVEMPDFDFINKNRY